MRTVPTGGYRVAAAILALGFLVVSCGGGGEDSAEGVGGAQAATAATSELLTPDSEAARDLGLHRVWKGDFDGMVERRYIRVLVPYSKSFYFIDRGVQRGITYEGMKLFEKWLNEELRTGALKVHLVIVPTTRDRMLPALAEGRGDIAAANLTITPERREMVDFSDPLAKGVREVPVTGPGVEPVGAAEDLAGREIYVRPSSSYRESLEALNEIFRSEGRPEMDLIAAEEYLEDEDLLEMVSAGIIPLVIVDEHKADLWTQVFDNITAHPDAAVRTGGEIAWAFRKGSPRLAETVNRFVANHKQGTLLGNVLINRYFKDTRWIKNALADAERERYEKTVDLFRTYAPQYEFDHLMMIAQGFQESGLDQSVVSRAGAIGIMQILPSTAAGPEVGIPDIHDAENNVHAGIKYMRWIRDTYFVDDEVDDANRTLFTFASYNAGPNRIRRLRQKAAEQGLDANKWFQNVEVVVAREVGREPVDYVSNIYKYYAAYRLMAERQALRDAARSTG